MERPLSTRAPSEAVTWERERDYIGLDWFDGAPARKRTVAVGDAIYEEGELNYSVYVVLEGWVMLYKILEDGRRQILDFALPGTILGFGAEPQSAMPHTASALTPTKTAVLPRGQLCTFISREPKLVMRFVGGMADLLASAHENLTDVGRRTSHAAIENLLVRLICRVLAGRAPARGEVVHLPLTLEHIADALGLTVPHVCRSLKSFRANRIITSRRGFRINVTEFFAALRRDRLVDRFHYS
jgi:CRP/FNR family transcriptional regulator